MQSGTTDQEKATQQKSKSIIVLQKIQPDLRAATVTLDKTEVQKEACLLQTTKKGIFKSSSLCSKMTTQQIKDVHNSVKLKEMMKLIKNKGKKPMPMSMLRCQHNGRSVANLEQQPEMEETSHIKVFSND